MVPVVLWRWVVLRVVRMPAIWVTAAALLAGLPLLQALRPLPTSQSASSLLLAWSLPSALVGTSMGLVVLSSSEAFLARLDARERFGAEWGGIWASSIVLQAPTLLGALLAGLSPSDLRSAGPAILTCCSLVASTALLLLIPPFSSALRVSLLLSVVWFVPALCASDPHLARVMSLLDARQSLRDDSHGKALVAAMALAWMAYLLRTRPVRAAPG